MSDYEARVARVIQRAARPTLSELVADGDDLDARIDGVKAALANAECGWMWVIADDHEWDRDLLPRLLDRLYGDDLDVPEDTVPGE